ncbi:MAG: hypothetical protein Q9218_006620, partial [Villophora microphyllina]
MFYLFSSIRIITAPAVTDLNGRVVCATTSTDVGSCGPPVDGTGQPSWKVTSWSNVFPEVNQFAQDYFQPASYSLSQISGSIQTAQDTYVSTDVSTVTTRATYTYFSGEESDVSIPESVHTYPVIYFSIPYVYIAHRTNGQRPDDGFGKRALASTYPTSGAKNTTYDSYDGAAEDLGYVPQALVDWMGQNSDYANQYPGLASCLPGGPQLEPVNGCRSELFNLPIVTLPVTVLDGQTTLVAADTVQGRGCFNPAGCPHPLAVTAPSTIPFTPPTTLPTGLSSGLKAAPIAAPTGTLAPATQTAAPILNGAVSSSMSPEIAHASAIGGSPAGYDSMPIPNVLSGAEHSITDSPSTTSHSPPSAVGNTESPNDQDTSSQNSDHSFQSFISSIPDSFGHSMTELPPKDSAPPPSAISHSSSYKNQDTSTRGPDYSLQRVSPVISHGFGNGMAHSLSKPTLPPPSAAGKTGALKDQHSSNQNVGPSLAIHETSGFDTKIVFPTPSPDVNIGISTALDNSAETTSFASGRNYVNFGGTTPRQGTATVTGEAMSYLPANPSTVASVNGLHSPHAQNTPRSSGSLSIGTTQELPQVTGNTTALMQTRSPATPDTQTSKATSNTPKTIGIGSLSEIFGTRVNNGTSVCNKTSVSNKTNGISGGRSNATYTGPAFS